MPLLDVAGRGTGRRSSSISRTSRCSARASGCSGRAGRSRSGLEYVGADFRFRPPAYLPAPAVPSLAVIGTGKRIGKTAVTGHVARLLSQRRRRRRRVDGPRRASGAGARPGRADAGSAPRHLSRGRARGLRLPGDRGARRCPDDRLPARGRRARRRRVHVEPAARDRARRRAAPDVVVFDGSGASMPPVSVDGRVLVVGPGQDATGVSQPVPRARLGPRPADGRRRDGADPRARRTFR